MTAPSTFLPTSCLVLRTAYLLEAARAPAFDALRPAYPHLRFLLSVLWPPYSFVTPMETAEPVAMPQLLKLGSR